MTLHEGEAPLRVEKARVNRTLFIAKFPRQMDADQLRAQVEPYGEIESVSIIKNHVTGKSRGCGFVKFAFREDAALALQEIRDSQKRWVVEWAKSTNDPESLRLDKNCIFIGGLNSKEVTEDLLRERFQAYGELESVTLVYRESEVPEDEDKAPRSAFAFVRYDNIQSSENAIEAENGIEWLGQKIKVQYSESKEMKHRRRLKKYSAMYEPFPYYTMPVMYLPDGMYCFSLMALVYWKSHTKGNRHADQFLLSHVFLQPLGLSTDAHGCGGIQYDDARLAWHACLESG